MASPMYEENTHGSIVSPALRKIRSKETHPVRDFRFTTSEMSDWYIADGDARAAQCGISWLRSWADQNALLGPIENLQRNGQAGGHSAQTQQTDFLAAVGLTWLKLQAAASGNAQAAINAWLGKIAARVQEYARTTKLTARNNIYYWSGLGVMAAGIARKDSAALAESAKVFDFALGQIQDDGTLPHELNREGRALIYHAKAAHLLVVMAELARSQGQDWYSHHNHRLTLLVERVVAGLKSPAYFKAKTGVAQEPLVTQKWGWLMYWQKQSQHPEEIAALLQAAPDQDYSFPEYGGNPAALVQKHFFDPKPR